jgi:hypothetical protein
MEKIKLIAILIVALTVGGVGGFYSQTTSIPQTLTVTVTSILPQLVEAQTVTITTTVSLTQPIGIPVMRSVEARVEDVIVYYREELFWSEYYFSEITENQKEFTSFLIKKFEEDLSKHGEGGENTVQTNVEFDEARGSTILTCEVHGAISRSNGSYHATFFWLLRPLGLDFIDDRFEHPERSLYWEGQVEGIPTKLVVKLPVSVTAWGHPNGHCHAHVWWELYSEAEVQEYGI